LARIGEVYGWKCVALVGDAALERLDQIEAELKRNLRLLSPLVTRQRYLARRLGTAPLYQDTHFPNITARPTPAKPAMEDPRQSDRQTMSDQALIEEQAELQVRETELRQQRARLLREQLLEQLSSSSPRRHDPQEATTPTPLTPTPIPTHTTAGVTPFHQAPPSLPGSPSQTLLSTASQLSSSVQLEAPQLALPLFPSLLCSALPVANLSCINGASLAFPPPYLTYTSPLTQAPCWPSFTNFSPTLPVPLRQQPLLDELVFPLHPP
jgi:hypothetical protein